jgi:3-oxoacyl-[acyl-carrier protein] reductase
VVTGASRGIGRAVAVELAREGARVVVNYNRNEEAAAEVVDQIEVEGGQAEAVRADVGDETDVAAMFDLVAERHGRLDVLVNNAGASDEAAFGDMTADQFTDVLRTNLVGTFLCARQALPLMASSGSGAMVMVSSMGGISGMERNANYAASKGGVIAMTKGLAREAASQGIRANVVAPGFIDTDMTRSVPRELLGTYRALIPLKRLGTAEEVAHMVTFLASARASYITGRVFVIDGGLLLA